MPPAERCTTRTRWRGSGTSAIPPAWQQVWICRSPRPSAGHRPRCPGPQAISLSPRWRRVRDDAKFDRMLGLRPGAAPDPRRGGGGAAQVRPGAAQGAGGRGASAGDDADPRRQRRVRAQPTILRPDHAARSARQDRGRAAAVRVSAARRQAARRRPARPPAGQHRRAMPELPGQELFQYLDEDGRPQPIGSADVNDICARSAGDDFTAKDFRTWAGTVLAALGLARVRAFDSRRPRPSATSPRRSSASPSRLGNTPAICRKSYVHPEIVGAYLDGSLLDNLKAEIEAELRAGAGRARARGSGGARLPAAAPDPDRAGRLDLGRILVLDLAPSLQLPRGVAAPCTDREPP